MSGYDWLSVGIALASMTGMTAIYVRGQKRRADLLAKYRSEDR